MTGDRHTPESSFGRWIDAFDDGQNQRTGKGKRQVPSLTQEKRYERRRRRHEAKQETAIASGTTGVVTFGNERFDVINWHISRA